jgi:hypothetical protein
VHARIIEGMKICVLLWLSKERGSGVLEDHEANLKENCKVHQIRIVELEAQVLNMSYYKWKFVGIY